MKDSWSILLLILLLTASFYLGRYSASWDNKLPTSTIKRDTVVIERPSEPILIEKVRSKIKYLRDTIIQTMPFAATVDTIIKRDTIFAKFNFPENQFDLIIRKKPDSTIYHTIYITKEVVKDRAWFELPAYFVGGSAIGFIFGLIAK